MKVSANTNCSPCEGAATPVEDSTWVGGKPHLCWSFYKEGQACPCWRPKGESHTHVEDTRGESYTCVKDSTRRDSHAHVKDLRGKATLVLKILQGGTAILTWKTIQEWLELADVEPNYFDLSLVIHCPPLHSPNIPVTSTWSLWGCCNSFLPTPNYECHQRASETYSRGFLSPAYIGSNSLHKTHIFTFVCTFAKFGRGLISPFPFPEIVLQALRQAKQPFPREQDPNSLHSGLS